MIDATEDLAAMLDDCGQVYETDRGSIPGFFIDEPVTVRTPGGHEVDISEPVLYVQQAEIDRARVRQGDTITANSRNYYVKKIPPADTAGLVRVELST